ncbi:MULTISPECIES: hypothetical protein [unclassified Pseudomonas]|uniref:hypothetical protein n=1 Tax=unclassified Pseudomonas TaxID=196821 RepID=UPI0023E365E1|nr:hypothetical protein [Pseudomonas sp. D3]WET12043.1 hypothetical protein P3S72_07885 [Pseudomonas sp. D3]
MDYFIIVVTTVAGLYFHGWLYLRIRRWIDRDLALSLAGSDLHKRAFMLQQLEKARTLKINRRELPAWLKNAAQQYTPEAS